MLRRLYLSPFGVLISFILNILGKIHKPFMVYGFFNKTDRKFYKYTRISSSTKLINSKNINIQNHVWIGDYCVLDGSGGIDIGEGVQFGSLGVIYTHSSHISIRLLGRKYIEIPVEQRKGYIIKNVSIGEYTFVGISCTILPGVKIGKGCIIGAGSLVNIDIPDYSLAVGNPIKIVGDSRKIDSEYLVTDEDKMNYYDSSIF